MPNFYIPYGCAQCVIVKARNANHAWHIATRLAPFGLHAEKRNTVEETRKRATLKADYAYISDEIGGTDSPMKRKGE